MNTKILKNFGQQVRKKRLAAGFSQEEFAEKLGIHRTYVSFIERGIRNPSLIMIFKISKVLKVKMSEMFDFWCWLIELNIAQYDGTRHSEVIEILR